MRACIVGAFALLACAPLLAMAAAVFDSSASWLLSLNDFIEASNYAKSESTTTCF